MEIIPAIKSGLKTTPVYNLVSYFRKRRQITDWQKNGRPLPPPPAVKQKIVASYAKQFKINTLIETGTFMGDMIDSTKGIFKQIYSIELSEKLFKRAKDRFKDYHHVTLIHGDSGQALPSLLRTITSPCLFWLDGHYSGDGTARGKLDTPIIQEVHAILHNSCHKHAVLIDDARCFDGKNGYPTIKALRDLFETHSPDWSFENKHDIVRVYPHEWSNYNPPSL